MLRQAGLVCRTSAAHARPHPRRHHGALPRPGQGRCPSGPCLLDEVQLSQLLRLSHHRRGLHTSPRAALPAQGAAAPVAPVAPAAHGTTPRTPQPWPRRARRGARDAEPPEPPKWRMLSGSHRFQAIVPGLKWLEEKEGASFADAQDAFRRWDRMFQHLYRRLEGEPAIPLTEAAETPGGALARELLRFETVDAMRSRWLEEPVAHRKLCWPDAMLTVMDSRPQRAALVLEAILEPSVAPFWAVPDVMNWLEASSSEKLPAHLRTTQQAALPALLLHLLETTPQTSFKVNGWLIGSIVSRCDAPTAARIYKALREYHHALHYNTQFKIASVLADDGRYRMLGLEILENLLTDPRLDPTDRRCSALATKLLTLPRGSKQGLVSPVHMQAVGEGFARLVERGYTPNLITYTALIRSLTSSDQLTTAWKMFDLMIDQGLKPDPYLFLVLLSGAKRASRSDLAARALKYAPTSVLWDPVIWHELLHCILTFAYEEHKWTKAPAPHFNPGFGPMLRAYSKYFKMEPLQKLIPQDLSRRLEEDASDDDQAFVYAWQHSLVPLVNELPALPEDQKVEPSVPTLNVMIAGYIRNFPSVVPVLEFYTHFEDLLRKRDPLALSLPQGSTVLYDFVIKAVVDNAGMLDRAMDIVASMLQAPSPSTPSPLPFSDAVSAGAPASAQTGPEASTDQETSEQYSPVPHPVRPSVYTWSILIYSVIRSRRPLRSLELLRMMQSYGVKPDRATWTTLIYGFAGTRYDDEAMEALRSLVEEGFHPGAHTIRAVGRMRRAEDVLKSVDKTAEEEDARVAAEINEATSSVPPLDAERAARAMKRPSRLVRRRSDVLNEEIARQNAHGFRVKAWDTARARMARLLQSMLPADSDLKVASMSLADILKKIDELRASTGPHGPAEETQGAAKTKETIYVSTNRTVGKVGDTDADVDASLLAWEAAAALPEQPQAETQPVPEPQATPARAKAPAAAAAPPPPPPPTPPKPPAAPGSNPRWTPTSLGVAEYMQLFEDFTRLQDAAADDPTRPPVWLLGDAGDGDELPPHALADGFPDALDGDGDRVASLAEVTAEIRNHKGTGTGTGTGEERERENRAAAAWLRRIAAAGPRGLHKPGRDADIEEAVGLGKRRAGRRLERAGEGEEEEGEWDGEESFRKLREAGEREERERRKSLGRAEF